MPAVNQLISNINTYILNPLILLMFGVAMVVFLYGVFEYVSQSAESDARVKGRQHMIYGIIGLVIMISAFGIVRIVIGTFGISSVSIDSIQK